jgi:hypothetical protein
MKPVGRGERGIKKNVGGGDFNYDILRTLVNVTMYHTHTTIIEKKFSLAWY